MEKAQDALSFVVGKQKFDRWGKGHYNSEEHKFALELDKLTRVFKLGYTVMENEPSLKQKWLEASFQDGI
jgi:hypothetical protein